MNAIIDMIEEQSWSSDVDFSNSEYGGSRASLAASIFNSPTKSARSLRVVREVIEELPPAAPDLQQLQQQQQNPTHEDLLDVHSSNCSDDVSTSTPEASQSSSNATERTALEKRGLKAINRSKALVYAALIVAAVAVGTCTYFFIRNGEQALFRSEVSETVMSSAYFISASKGTLLTSLSFRHSLRYTKG